jgi:hypothetical protein
MLIQYRAGVCTYRKISQAGTIGHVGEGTIVVGSGSVSGAVDLLKVSQALKCRDRLRVGHGGRPPSSAHELLPRL